MTQGERVVIRSRPLSGRGVIEKARHGFIGVRLDGGELVWATEIDLMAEEGEQEPAHTGWDIRS